MEDKLITVSIRKMSDKLWRKMSCVAKLKGMTILEYISDLIQRDLEAEGLFNEEVKEKLDYAERE